MKKSLKEHLERIHRLNYGNKVLKEDFVGALPINEQVKKIDDPKKADVVGVDTQGKQIADDKLVQDFYATFEKAISSGGLKQQSHGSMMYQKEVESMQIGLSLLGYELPKYGVDGLFGPETAQAVDKFANDNKIDLSKKTVNESKITMVGIMEALLNSPLDSTSVNSSFGKQRSYEKHPGVDMKAASNTDVKSPANGEVIDAAIRNNACGGTLFIDHNNGFRSRYCHLRDILVNKGDSVTQGQVVAKSGGDQSASEGRGRSTGAHLHFELYKDGKLVNPLDYIDKSGVMTSSNAGPSVNNITATPELLTKLLELVKGKNLSPADLKAFMDKTIRSSGAPIDVKDWQGIVNTIIDNLEGGYYHPDMLQDGRVKDSRFGNSGETMFGMDRKAGGIEATGPAGQEFWRLIDAEDARHKWKHGYMLKDNPSLATKLRELAGQIMKPLFDQYSRRYLKPDALAIVTKDPALTFNFAYAVWNGPGWFQKFAAPVNKAVESGTTDPKELLDIALDRRTGSGNSLIAQGGKKVANIANRISDSSSSMA